MCRNHGWPFDVESGRRAGGSGCLRACPAREVDGQLWVDVAAVSAAAPARPAARADARARPRPLDSCPGRAACRSSATPYRSTSPCQRVPNDLSLDRAYRKDASSVTVSGSGRGRRRNSCCSLVGPTLRFSRGPRSGPSLQPVVMRLMNPVNPGATPQVLASTIPLMVDSTPDQN